MSEKNAASIFSQKLDRSAFTAYFLGAVVPLLGMVVIAQQFALPTLEDRLATLGILGSILSIGALSLGSFFALRRTTRRALERMDRDNHQLSSLLRAANAFGNAQHEAEAAATAVRCALELSAADAVYAFARSDPARPAVLLESLGREAEKLRERLADPITELVDLVLREGRPALRGPAAGAGWGDTAAAAIPLMAENKSTGALIAIRRAAREGFATDSVDALATLGALASASMHNADLRDAQRNFFAHMTELLVTALDSHLLQQRGHGNRVAQYANRVGRHLQLDDTQLQRLHFSALLHDIGMLRIERSRLTNASACEKHPVIGARMLEPIRLWADVAPIVLHHHERFDGTGYPEGLAADAIPLEARIIAVCECFDVMVSEASYRIATSPGEAVDEIVACSGTQFDPDVVAAFKTLADQGVFQTLA